MFILCNDTLDLDGKDKGLARRIRKINLASQFTEIKEPDLKNHTYPINVDMSDMGTGTDGVVVGARQPRLRVHLPFKHTTRQ